MALSNQFTLANDGKWGLAKKKEKETFEFWLQTNIFDVRHNEIYQSFTDDDFSLFSASSPFHRMNRSGKRVIRNADDKSSCWLSPLFLYARSSCDVTLSNKTSFWSINRLIFFLSYHFFSIIQFWRFSDVHRWNRTKKKGFKLKHIQRLNGKLNLDFETTKWNAIIDRKKSWKWWKSTNESNRETAKAFEWIRSSLCIGMRLRREKRKQKCARWRDRNNFFDCHTEALSESTNEQISTFRHFN